MDQSQAQAQQQLRQMLAMSAGNCHGTHPSVGAAGPDQNFTQACAQMTQMLQFLEQGVVGMPPMPYAGLHAPAPEPVVIIYVEGMRCQYQLTEEDLLKVFSRFGPVRQIKVEHAGSASQITFQNFPDAQRAIDELDGKVLTGLEGTLRIQWANSAPVAPPYSALSPPGWGYMPPALAPPWQSNAPEAPPLYGPGPRADVREGQPSHVKNAKKFTCRFIIGVDNDKEFQVVRRIIGAKGINMKKIVQETDAKLRLRGVGSGYFEGAAQKESPEPLQLCISCTNPDGYALAITHVEELLSRVYGEYQQFCKMKQLPEPHLQLNFSESAQNQPTRSQPPSNEPEGLAMKPRRGPRSQGKASGSGDDGLVAQGTPSLEEIEKFIDERNVARRAGNFAEADRIRKLLRSRGVALMDEPGGRGRGSEVTTWRHWRD